MTQSRRSIIFDLSVFFGCLGVLSYFGWHGFYGPRSIEHSRYISAQVEKHQSELKKVQNERIQRDAQVALLRPQSIDPDMLDEQARKTLQFTAENDLVIVTKSN